jgi:bacillithiol biosynthesis cysteine-adding enzyme BshC
MEPGCLRHTDIPHTTRLFSDFQYHFDRVASFYRYPPNDPSSYVQAAKEIALPDERRAALVTVLKARNGDSASLDLLARPGTVAVVTGQQVGLFSGPAYTIYKALTAARLAADLSQRGIPAVPIFWLATEDHDLAEVNHSFVFDNGHRPILLDILLNADEAAGASDRPVGAIQIKNPPIETLRNALAAFPYGEEVVSLVGEAYPSGVTFGAGFQRLLERLLAKYGLLFLDPLDAAFRRLAAPLLAKALRDRDQLTQKLLERNAQLEAAGYHAQVHVEQKTSLVFLLDGDRRITLRRQNGDFLAKDRRYSAAELIDNAEHLSPNALLRPVVQDYVLPTVAYVGGPAELAYMAQSEVVYEDLLGRMPVMLSRGAFTLLDARAAKLMERYELTVPSLLHGEEAVRELIAQKLVPPALLRQFAEIQNTTGQALDRLKTDLTAFDPTLAAAVDKARAKMLYQLAKTERKAAREAVKRDERAEADASYLSGLVYPDKHLQERFYSILPFLAQHGFPLLDRLYEHVGLECPDHKVLVA